MQTQTAVVVAKQPATRRACLVTIEPHAGVFGFCAGQALFVRVPPLDRPCAFSIACSPEWARASGRLELLIGTTGGRLAAQLTQCGIGSPIEIAGPVGTFGLAALPAGTPLLFIAGGTGIAPIRAIIDHLRHRPRTPEMSLIYCARAPDDFAFREELARHTRDQRLLLRYVITRRDGDGADRPHRRIDAQLLRECLPRPDATGCLVCGPPALVAAASALLHELGVPPRNLVSPFL